MLVGLVTCNLAGLELITLALGPAGSVKALIIEAMESILCQEKVHFVWNIFNIDDTLLLFVGCKYGGTLSTGIDTLSGQDS